MWPLSPLVFRSIAESGSFVLKLFPPSPYSISCKSFQRCFKSKNSTKYTLYLTRSSTDDEKVFDVTLNGSSLAKPRLSDTNKSESVFKPLLTESNLRGQITNNNGFNNGLHTNVNDRVDKDRFDSPRDDNFKDRTLQIDEKFRLHLEGKTPSQMVDILRTYRHLMDLGRFRTFIKQISCTGYIYEYHLSPEQFELIHNMLLNFPEMTSDISNLSDVSHFVSQLRVDSKIPLLQYIAGQMVKKIDELSFDQVFNLYKSLQAIRIPLLHEGSDISGQFDVLNDDVLRARYLLISNVAFRIETLHFDETDIVTLCEVFRRINKEIFAKEAIDILSKSIVSMSSYMKSKNSTDIIAGLTTTNGAKILNSVVASKDKVAIKKYRDLIDLSMIITGRLTNTDIKPNPFSSQYISDCFFRMLLKEANKFNQASFWYNFLSEIDFNRHKLDLHAWQNLLTLINRFRVYCPSIIDTIAPIVIKNANAYIQDRQISPIPYIRLMAECYHKPLTANWDKFVSILLHPKKLSEIPADRFLSLLSRLAILEDYSKIRDFDTELIKSTLTVFRNSAQSKRLLTLYSGLAHEADNSNKKWLTKREFYPFVTKAIFQLNKDLRFGPISPLQSILETLFGGPEFVVHGIWTKTGLLMHHLLVFRRGEYPVAVRNIDSNFDYDTKITFLYDIPVPSEAKIVTVVPAYKYFYSNHSKNLRGKIQFKLRLIRKLGIIPVLVDISEFEELSAHERSHWLITKIRNVITEDNNNAWEFWR